MRELTNQQQLEAAIAALESQREVLGNVVVDTSIAAIRHQLAETKTQFVEQQRKQITVLFADVSGFTAMASEMDAEVVGEVINTLWQRLDKVIAAHGGFVDKHFGDGVMALWGVRTSQEEDPERAIQAALAMQEDLVSFRQEVRHGLEMRIGINTGPVLLGRVGATDEFTAIGDTVNTADRLEKVAPVSTVLITHNTYQHVRGVFDVKPMEPISVRGKQDPLQVYIVSRAKAHSFRSRQRGVEGVETRMIGRWHDFKRLKETLNTVIETREMHAITITAAAGLGKSRLLYEFENWADLLDVDVFFLRGRARKEDRQVPFSLFRDIFDFRFGIHEDDPPAIMREKLEAGLCESVELGQQEMSDKEIEGRAHIVGHLLGYNLDPLPYLASVLNDPKQMRDRAFVYLLDYIRTAAADDPILLMVEDLHWADDSSLDTLTMLAQSLADLPLFILTSTRPSFYSRRPSWFAGIKHQMRFELRPLSRRENRSLVYEILKLAEDVPDSVRDLIVENSQGNPFYAEELVKMLIDEGAIIKGEESWIIPAEKMAAIRVPPTLTGIVQARLDRLTPVQKMVILQASVIGRVFWDKTLIYLNQFTADGLVEDEIEDALSTLRERELIFKRTPSNFSHSAEYVFTHPILREVAYECVLLRNRGVYHGLTADWLGAQSGERSVGMVGLTADHLIKAGRSAEAVTDLHLAGNEAALRFANEEAKTYFSRALALTSPEDQETRFQLLLDREAVFDILGSREEQKADLKALEDLSLAFGPTEMARVALRNANFEEATADYEAMIKAAQKAIQFVSNDGPPLILSRAHLDWGLALERLGKFHKADEQLHLSLIAALTGGESRLAGLALCGLGIVARAMGNHKNAYHHYEQALEQFIDLDDLNDQSSTLIWMGVLSTDMGDFANARNCYEKALELTRKTGYRYHESYALSNLGSNASHQGNYEHAVSLIEQALKVARDIDNRLVECLCLNNLGTINLNQSNFKSALANYQQSLAIALNTGHRRMEAAASTGAGHALIHLGDPAAGITQLNHAIHIRRELEEVHLYESLAILAFAHKTAGDLDAAREIIDEVLDFVQNNGEFYATEYGLRNYLYVIDTLESLNHPQADFILERAYKEFLQASGRIPDELTRTAFLENVPYHREIAYRWQQSGR
jgi:predicted ATPase/class 3 adenylate cyclase